MCKGITQQNKGIPEGIGWFFIHPLLFLRRTHTLKHIPAEVPFTFNITSFGTFCQYKWAHCKSCNLRIKDNSSCNWNWLPPTQGHSLWTSHSPYSRLTLNMPYWTPLENNSSIGNFQGTGCEETKSISLVAATHIICHSVIHRVFFLLLLKAIFIVCE